MMPVLDVMDKEPTLRALWGAATLLGLVGFAAAGLRRWLVIPELALFAIIALTRLGELAVFTILNKREYPESKLLPRPDQFALGMARAGGAPGGFGGAGGGVKRSVRVLEAGVVGTLDYKIIVADQADDLFTWLK